MKNVNLDQDKSRLILFFEEMYTYLELDYIVKGYCLYIFLL